MGQLFISFKRYNYRLSNFLNSSKNCYYGSTMTGLKIAIIFFAIAMISAIANAGCLQNSDCEESHACDTTTNRCYTFKENYYCRYGNATDSYFTLSDAIKGCNANSQCKCIEDYKRADIVPTKRYHLSTSGTPYRDSLYDAWIKN